jgi:hypothetical protein
LCHRRGSVRSGRPSPVAGPLSGGSSRPTSPRGRASGPVLPANRRCHHPTGAGCTVILPWRSAAKRPSGVRCPTGLVGRGVAPVSRARAGRRDSKARPTAGDRGRAPRKLRHNMKGRSQ